MPELMKIDRSPESKLLAAVKEFAAARMGFEITALDGLTVKDSYPRISFEHGIYSDEISIEIDLARVPRR